MGPMKRALQVRHVAPCLLQGSQSVSVCICKGGGLFSAVAAVGVVFALNAGHGGRVALWAMCVSLRWHAGSNYNRTMGSIGPQGAVREPGQRKYHTVSIAWPAGAASMDQSAPHDIACTAAAMRQRLQCTGLLFQAARDELLHTLPSSGTLKLHRFKEHVSAGSVASALGEAKLGAHGSPALNAAIAALRIDGRGKLPLSLWRVPGAVPGIKGLGKECLLTLLLGRVRAAHHARAHPWVMGKLEALQGLWPQALAEVDAAQSRQGSSLSAEERRARLWAQHVFTRELRLLRERVRPELHGVIDEVRPDALAGVYRDVLAKPGDPDSLATFPRRWKNADK